MNLSAVIWWSGVALLVIAAAALIPVTVCFLTGVEQAASGYGFTFAICLLLGLGFLFIVRDTDRGYRRAGMREVVLLLIIWWVVTPFFASMPFVLEGMPLYDAWFEATSALTTTGGWLSQEGARATLHGMIWRAELQWLGGLVSIAAAAAIFIRPEFVGVAALSPPFSSGETLSYLKAFRAALLTFLPVYFAGTLFFILSLTAFGVPVGEAMVLAMSFLASGGFVPAVAGLDAYNSGVQVLCFLMMLLSAVSFITVVYAINASQSRRALFRQDQETPIILLFVFIIGAVYVGSTGSLEVEGLLPQMLNAASFISTNGVVIGDQPALIPVLVTAIIGGAAVSTAGGIKILRWRATFERAGEEIWKLIHPQGVSGRSKTLNELGVWIHFISFTLILSITVLTITIFGNSLELSVTTAVAAISNTGPMLFMAPGDIVDYAHFHPLLRTILAMAMIIGRLEMVVALALFNRFFWRQ
jgi:trk system potassium uptake protein TrkH